MSQPRTPRIRLLWLLLLAWPVGLLAWDREKELVAIGYDAASKALAETDLDLPRDPE